MKNLKAIVVLSVFTLVVFGGCKKYPEDDKRIWKTVMSRITARWALKECTINGIKSDVFLNNNYGEAVLLINKKIIDDNYNGYMTFYPNGNYTLLTFNWRFLQKKENIQFTEFKYETNPITNCVGVFDLPNTKKQVSILKLTNSEFWFQSIYNGDSYIFKFQLINL